MIRTIGNWVAIKPLVEESKSGIISESIDKGVVVDNIKWIRDLHDSNKGIGRLSVGDKVHFDINKVQHKEQDYWIFHIDNIYGVIG